MKCKIKLRYAAIVVKGGKNAKQFVDLDSSIEAPSLQDALPEFLQQKGIKYEQVIRALVQKA